MPPPTLAGADQDTVIAFVPAMPLTAVGAPGAPRATVPDALAGVVVAVPISLRKATATVYVPLRSTRKVQLGVAVSATVVHVLPASCAPAGDCTVTAYDFTAPPFHCSVAAWSHDAVTVREPGEVVTLRPATAAVGVRTTWTVSSAAVPVLTPASVTGATRTV